MILVMMKREIDTDLRTHGFGDDGTDQAQHNVLVVLLLHVAASPLEPLDELVRLFVREIFFEAAAMVNAQQTDDADAEDEDNGDGELHGPLRVVGLRGEDGQGGGIGQGGGGGGGGIGQAGGGGGGVAVDGGGGCCCRHCLEIKAES